MTANRKQKKAVRARAAASNVSYLDARRDLARREHGGRPPGDPAGSARALWGEVADLFHARGWPVELEGIPQWGQWVLYAGPMRVAVTDPGLDPQDDPLAQQIIGDRRDGASAADAPATEGPAAAAGAVSLSAPFLGSRPDATGDELAAGARAADVVDAAEAAMTRGRAVALQAARSAPHRPEECTVCGGSFPVGHLLCPTPVQELAACPVCVFDGDLTTFYADPPFLAYQLDGLLDTDLAVPAPWAAVAVLLAESAGEDLADHLERAWRQAGTVTVPDARWSDADLNWIWLAPHERRPGWQTGLGPGARPDALVSALEAAHPELHEAFVQELHEGYLDETEHPRPDPGTLAVGWRAAVTYASALHTEMVENDQGGDLRYAVDSFDALGEHLRGLGSDSDDILLTAMIEAGITVLCEHGAIPTPADTP